MFAALPVVLALASFAAARPIAIEVIAAVSASLTLPNTTQTNNATYYNQNGNAGACGLYSEDSDYVVGLPLEFYSELGSVSPYCGSYVVVTNVVNNATVISRIADASATSEVLSLSVATYNALDGDASNLRTVTWRFANKTEAAAAKASVGSTTFTPVVTSAQVAAATSSAPASTSSVRAAAAVAPSSSSTSSYVPTTSTTQYVAPPTTTTTTSKWVAPTTTTTTTTTSKWVAPATTQAQKAPSSGGDSYSGQATYFTQNGNPGACGHYNSDSTYLVALDSRMYSGGSHCGQNVVITGNGKTITAVVADECPSCVSSGSLDLSVGAFGALASYDAGVVSISWHFA